MNQVAYITGRTNNVSTVAPNRPPAMAMAMGPQNVLGMSGAMPKIAAAAVNMIGRKRSTAELMMASQGACPSAMCFSIWSIRMTEFRMIIPPNAKMPSSATKPMGLKVAYIRTVTPMMPRGAVSSVNSIRDTRCS